MAIEDKYIGIALAVGSAVANGASFIITKKGLNDAGSRSKSGKQASENLAYLRNPIWWAGMTTHIVAELANFAAYTFAPATLVTPLGALSVILGAVLASFFLGERLGHLGRLGCAICLLGALTIILHAPSDNEDIKSVEEFLEFAFQPGFMLYCFIALVFSLVMAFWASPRYGRTIPLVYISICSLAGSVSVMAIKGFGLAVKLTLSGRNQFTHLSTYFLGVTVAGCIVVQMNYFNKALDTFSTNVVNPTYYVVFTTSTIVASIILFHGFNTDDAAGAISLVTGFIVTFLGVHLLNFSRTPEDPIDYESTSSLGQHSALERGLMSPRLRLQGRMSVDGWENVGFSPLAGGPSGHGRSSSSLGLPRPSRFNDRAGGVRREHVKMVPLRREDDVSDDTDPERTSLARMPGGAS